MAEVFRGNCPRNVSKDAKYAVRTGEKGLVIALVYRTNAGEQWLATTDHPELVEMVNNVKRAHGHSINGPFYINEYKQVIVPVGNESEYYYAGEYSQPLIFELNKDERRDQGIKLSGQAVNLDGMPLSPGDVWVGPHAGIPYVLAAGGSDIYYEHQVRRNVTKKVKLSEHIGRQAAREVASMIAEYKGYAGGRFYVNEWQTIFAPMPNEKADSWNYIYIGQLPEESKWFPKPEVGQDLQHQV